MTDFSTCLTDAERERLALLIEECGEIQQVVGKILRHGFESFHPDTPTITNRTLLEMEIGDASFVMNLLMNKGDINKAAVINYRYDKRERIEKFLHFNFMESNFMKSTTNKPKENGNES